MIIFFFFLILFASMKCLPIEEDDATVLLNHGLNLFNCKNDYKSSFNTQRCDINVSNGIVYVIADVGCFAKFYCNFSILTVSCCVPEDSVKKPSTQIEEQKYPKSQMSSSIIHNHIIPKSEKLATSRYFESENKLKTVLTEEFINVKKDLIEQLRWHSLLFFILFGGFTILVSSCKLICYRKMKIANQNIVKCIQGLADSGSPVRQYPIDNYCRTCQGVRRLENIEVPAIQITEASASQPTTSSARQIARHLDFDTSLLNDSMLTNDGDTRK